MADEAPDQKGASGPSSSPDAPLTGAERSLVRRLSSALRFADFMALLMVAATALSAFATWRTTQLMNTILMVSERPYIGVHQVRFDSIDTTSARIAIDTRNFGSVSANDVVSQIRMLIDGHQIAGMNRLTATVNVGIMSPTVPHATYRFLPVETYRSVREGKTRLMIDVLISYRGPDERQFCYDEIITYDRQSGAFGASGGGDRCDGQIL